jgi:hypothetical protein
MVRSILFAGRLAVNRTRGVAGRSDETDHLATAQGLLFRFVFALDLR